MLFMLRLALLVIALVGLFFSVQQGLPAAQQPVFPEMTFALLVLFTSFAHGLLLMVSKLNKQQFTPWYMGIMVVKLLIYGTYVFAVIFKLQDEAVPDVVLFLLVYLVLLAFELWQSVGLVRQHWGDSAQD